MEATPLRTGWLSHAGTFKVEHVPFTDAGPLLPDAINVRRGVQHTTEGETLEGALAAYRTKQCAPTFTLGHDAKQRVRILQHVPLGHAARALENHPGGVETNRVVIAQIELVGVSQQSKWLPAPPVEDALASLYAVLYAATGIPLVHVANLRRSPKRWQEKPGWYGHADVPENNHIDPRGLNYASVFALAGELAVTPTVKPHPSRKPTDVLNRWLLNRATKAHEPPGATDG
jgi:hypothetical protein